MIAADYPLLDVMWTMLVFFLWVFWFWILITVWTDVFRRHDISGLSKTAWFDLHHRPAVPRGLHLLDHAGQGDGRANLERFKVQQAQMDDYVRATAGSAGPAAEIEKAKQLLDSGAITQEEYSAMKQRALA